MKKYIKLNYIISIFLFLLPFGPVFAQDTCFMQLDNFTGFELSQVEFDELNQEVCDLIDSLPQEFQDSFKIFSFSLYLNNNVMLNNISEFIESGKQKASNSSKYYLLVGFYIDLNNKMQCLTDLKLPNSGIFSCYDNDYFDVLEYEIKSKIQNGLLNGRISSYSIKEAYLTAIDILRFIVLMRTQFYNHAEPICIFRPYSASHSGDIVPLFS